MFLREWLSVNRVPIDFHASAVDTVEKVSDTFLRVSKQMRKLKKDLDVRTGAEDNSVVLQQVTSENEELKKSLTALNDRLVEMGKQVSETKELESEVESLRESSLQMDKLSEEMETLRSRSAELERQLEDAATQQDSPRSEELEQASALIAELTTELENLRDNSSCSAQPGKDAGTDGNHKESSDANPSMEDYELLRDEYDKLVRSVVSKDEFERQKQELEQLQADFKALGLKLETSESSVAQLKEQTVEAEKHRKALQECQVNSGNHINEVKLLQAELDRAEKDLEGKTEQTTDEPNCDEECSRQQMKLRTNLQKQADALRKRTFDAEVQFEEQKERCDELERAHNVTIASLEEQVSGDGDC
jgi:chromosome segregation ATPase